MNNYQYINLEYLNEVALGNQAFKKEMLETFCIKTPNSIAQMEIALQNQDYEQVGKIAHQLKTSFAFVGMDSTVELCKKMQDMGLKKNDVHLLPDCFILLKNNLLLGLKEIDNELNIL